MPDKVKLDMSTSVPLEEQTQKNSPPTPITKRADGTDTSVPSIADQEKQKQAFDNSTTGGATSISAAPSGGLAHPITWLQELQSDLQHGSGITSVGRVLQHIMPQNGMYAGKPEAVADIAGGMVLGPPKAAEGALRLAMSPADPHPVKEAERATNKIVSGVGQTAALPLMVVNPASGIPSMVGGGALSKIGQSGAEVLGGDKDTQELAGNLTSLAVPALMKGMPKIAKGVVNNPGTVAKAIAIPTAAMGVGAAALLHPLAAIPTAIGEAAYLPKAIKTTTGLIKAASPMISGAGDTAGAIGDVLTPGNVGDVFGGAVKQGPGQIPAKLRYSIPLLNQIPSVIPASVAGQALFRSQDDAPKKGSVTLDMSTSVPLDQD